MKLSIHITYFHNKNISNQTGKLKHNKIFYLQKIIKSYQKIKVQKKIFIHTNNTKILKKKICGKDISFIYHNLSNQNPRTLPWKCRDLINKQKNYFDYFIYTEDDILFTKTNFSYWLKHKDDCLKRKFNLGFLRFEYDLKRKKFLTDLTKSLFKFVKINKIKYIVNDQNPNCSFWIMDKNELKQFVKSKYWAFNWSNKNYKAYYDTEIMSAIGWHGLNMDRYIASVLPIINNTIHEGAYVHHIPNNYAGNKKGFGSLSVKQVLKKNLKEYDLINEKINDVFLYIIYKLRFFKKIFKT